VLLPNAASIAEADERLGERLTPELLEAAVSAVPDGWAEGQRYLDYLGTRLQAPLGFAEEAERERLAA